MIFLFRKYYVVKWINGKIKRLILSKIPRKISSEISFSMYFIIVLPFLYGSCAFQCGLGVCEQ